MNQDPPLGQAPNDAASTPTVVYTDGACSGNPGPGGWAWAVPDGPSGTGAEPDTTNQRMELRAVLEALTALDGPVHVISDSTYVVNCFNERWYEGWLQRNWRNANKKAVANRDLWEPLVEIFGRRVDELTFTWVKGHSGDPMNDYVDELAVEARDRLMGRTEAGVRSEASPGTAPTAAVSADAGGPVPPWPVERAVAIAGSGEPGRQQLERLDHVLDGLDPGYDIVVSGLRRGAELIGAELALDRQLPLAVVLPFADPVDHWPAAVRRRFQACVDRSEWLVDLEGERARPGTAVRRRDEWLSRAVVGYIVVGDRPLVERLDELGLGVISVDDSDGG